MAQVAEAVEISKIESLLDFVFSCWQRNEKLFTCGNGGLFAVSSHLEVDFSKGVFEGLHTHRLDAEQLGANASMITAVANDHRFGVIYKEQLVTKGKRGSIKYNFLPMSCSGNSENILAATEQAIRDKANVFAITGLSGGELLKIAPQSIYIPSMDYGVVEDIAHQIVHWLMKRLREKINLTLQNNTTHQFTLPNINTLR